MALSKIVGFEVRPRRSSSSISRCSSPLVTSRRSIWSYQTLCPTFASSESGFAMEKPPSKRGKHIARPARRVKFAAGHSNTPMRALQATPLGGNGIPQILGRGIELTARGEFARALEIFAAVYNNVSPERFPQGLSSYGLCLSRIEHKNKVGAELCEKAIALQPHDASHWANLVRLYAGAKNRRRAVDVLERAMKKLPNDERLLRVRTEIGYRQRP